MVFEPAFHISCVICSFLIRVLEQFWWHFISHQIQMGAEFWLENISWYCKSEKIENSNAISWKLWYHYIMHGGHYSYCKQKEKEKWAWTKESWSVGIWMILNIFLFSNFKNLIEAKNKTFLICRLMNFNPICSHT